MRSLLFVVCLILAVPSQMWADEVRVIGQRVNLRAKPDLTSEVPGQVNRGDVLSVRSIQDEWVEIVPPREIEFWVHHEFIEDGEVAPPRLNVRAGPGVNYSVVVTLERGDRVRTRSAFSDWVSIDPPESATLWVSRELVEVIRPEPPPPPPRPVPLPEPIPEPIPPPRPEPKPEPPPRVPPRPVVQPVQADPEPPKDLDLIPLEGQGLRVERDGILRQAGFVFGRPSRYRLVRQRGHSFETICYVKGNETQLDSLLGHSMKITGREYWVQGVRHAVVVPDEITLRPPE